MNRWKENFINIGTRIDEKVSSAVKNIRKCKDSTLKVTPDIPRRLYQ
jgi:hypothetical protein